MGAGADREGEGWRLSAPPVISPIITSYNTLAQQSCACFNHFALLHHFLNSKIVCEPQ